MNNKQKIYFFSQLQTDGDQNMVDILGGKGANIAEMCKLGLPVPPGFTLATSLCSDYCLLYTSPSPRDKRQSRMPSSA